MNVFLLGCGAVVMAPHRAPTLRDHVAVARRERSPRTLFLIDKQLMLVGGWLAFLTSLFTNVRNQAFLPGPVPVVADVGERHRVGAGLSRYSAFIAARVVRRQAVVSGLFTWITIVAMHGTLFFIFGRFEPLLPGFDGWWHARTSLCRNDARRRRHAQHRVLLACTFRSSAGRRELTPRTGWVESFARAPVKAYAVFIVVSLGYFWLSAGPRRYAWASRCSRSIATRVACAWRFIGRLPQSLLSRSKTWWRPHADARLRASSSL